MYSIILADPPWVYSNWKGKENGAAKAHYECLLLQDLCSLPIQEVAEDDSILFLWATFPKLNEAMKVIEMWGFKYITAPFVWNKTYSNGNPYTGLGFWTRSGAEVVLMGKRGKGLSRLSAATNVKQVITAPVLKPHSSKPPIVRDKIIDLVGDHSRIELFARPPIPHGWDAIGYEIDGKDIRQSLKEIIEKEEI